MNYLMDPGTIAGLETVVAVEPPAGSFRRDSDEVNLKSIMEGWCTTRPPLGLKTYKEAYKESFEALEGTVDMWRSLRMHAAAAI